MTALPLVTNQFAIDGAGLTLELLSPLSEDDILNGKAVGDGLLSAIPALLAMSAAMLLYPGGSIALWISVPLGMACVWLLVAPVAAALSSVFPKVVDLNSIGNRSNAHGVANLAGLAITAVSTLPPVGLALIATSLLEQARADAAAVARLAGGRVRHQPPARAAGARAAGAPAGESGAGGRLSGWSRPT